MSTTNTKLSGLLWLLFIMIFSLSCQDSITELRSENPAIPNQPAAVNPTILNDSGPIVLGYFPSWSESWTSTGQGSKLRDIPRHVNYVFLAFAKPNLTYQKGSFDLAGTGIQTPYGGATLKESVDALKSKGINVILSVGGETYWGTNDAYNINYQQIKDLVDDMGFAGIDWDFEPNGSFAAIGDQVNIDRFIDFFNQSRAIMPEGQYILACAPAGVGAIGGVNNDDPSSPFAHSQRNAVTGESDANLFNGTSPNAGISLFGFSSTGHMIPVIQAVGNKIDLIAFQGYNTGAATNRAIMYDAYRYYADQYGFSIAAGTHFPNEPWGPYYTYTHQSVGDLSAHISTKSATDGIMIWQLLLQDASASAYGYLHVASQVLNGTGVAAAVANAENYPPDPYSGDTGGGGGGTGEGTGCDSAPAWISSTAYNGGQEVLYDGSLYKAKWWTQNNIPSESTGSGQPWELIDACDGTGGGTGGGGTGGGGTGGGGTGGGGTGGGGTGGGGSTSCSLPSYEPYPTVYNTGDRVVYQSTIYEAQTGPLWVTPGSGEHWWKTIGPCE
ncbi:MAG: carbohydrate-binding protein [Reichenbachiella sp.]|uniref:carbohydrate-binding protein n=1 Tax=Reichenbachiella sp. TaxID=2184521 RepID=UPI0032662782